jgi:hypothetical protein
MPDETVSITQFENDVCAVLVKYKLFKKPEIFAALFKLMEKLLK